MRSLFPFLLRCCPRDRAGVAAIEFAIIAPVMILLAGAAWDLGNAVDRSIHLENAARTGAQYITRNPSDTAGAQAAAQAVLSGYGTISIGTMVCTCPPSGAATGGSAVDCATGTCTTGMTRYITVTATPLANQNPIFPISRRFISSTGGTNGVTVVRLQ